VSKEEVAKSILLTKYAFDDKKKEMKIYIELSEAPFREDDEILESMITFIPEE